MPSPAICGGSCTDVEPIQCHTGRVLSLEPRVLGEILTMLAKSPVYLLSTGDPCTYAWEILYRSRRVPKVPTPISCSFLVYSSYYPSQTRPLVLILGPHILYITCNIPWAVKPHWDNISHMSILSLYVVRSLLNVACEPIYSPLPHTRTHRLLPYNINLSGFYLSLFAL